MSSQMNSTVCPLISFIVPVWGDDELVIKLVRQMPLDPATGEWVIAAVDPSECLKNLDRSGNIRLVVCDQPSRGSQMNQGAARASGDLLCFHHADTELLPEHFSALIAVAADNSVIGGAFHRRFDNRHLWMIKWEGLVKRISVVTGPLFGDQSLFVKRRVFHEMGGFADIPLMEDLEFSRRLRRVGRIAMLEPSLWSSPRRFQRMGGWLTTLLNGGFILLFYLGVSPHRLHRWYYKK